MPGLPETVPAAAVLAADLPTNRADSEAYSGFRFLWKVRSSGKKKVNGAVTIGLFDPDPFA